MSVKNISQESARIPQQRQAKPESAGTLMGPQEAFSRMEEDQAVELRAYVLGVQAVIWGMQWVKAGRALRHFAAPKRPSSLTFTGC